MAADIAIVSFERFLDGDDKRKKEVAAEIYDAFSTVGWVYIKDHGVEGVEDAFNLVSVNNTSGTSISDTNLSSGKTVLRPTSSEEIGVSIGRCRTQSRIHCRW